VERCRREGQETTTLTIIFVSFMGASSLH
jgi:hypothetical protein